MRNIPGKGNHMPGGGEGLDNLRELKGRVTRARTAGRHVAGEEAGEGDSAHHMGFKALSSLGFLS